MNNPSSQQHSNTPDDSKRSLTQLSLSDPNNSRETELSEKPFSPIPPLTYEQAFQQSGLLEKNCENLDEILRLGKETAYNPAQLAIATPERMLLHASIIILSTSINIDKEIPTKAAQSFLQTYEKLRPKIETLLTEKPDKLALFNKRTELIKNDLDKIIGHFLEQTTDISSFDELCEACEEILKRFQYSGDLCCKTPLGIDKKRIYEDLKENPEKLQTELSSQDTEDEFYYKECLLHSFRRAIVGLREKTQGRGTGNLKNDIDIVKIRTIRLHRYETQVNDLISLFKEPILNLAKNQGEKILSHISPNSGVEIASAKQLMLILGAPCSGTLQAQPMLLDRWHSSSIGIGKPLDSDNMIRFSGELISPLLLNRDSLGKKSAYFREFVMREANQLSKQLIKVLENHPLPAGALFDRISRSEPTERLSKEFSEVSLLYVYTSPEEQISENSERVNINHTLHGLISTSSDLQRETEKSYKEIKDIILSPSKFISPESNARIDILRSNHYSKDKPSLVASFFVRKEDEKPPEYECRIFNLNNLLEFAAFSNILDTDNTLKDLENTKDINKILEYLNVFPLLARQYQLTLAAELPNSEQCVYAAATKQAGSFTLKILDNDIFNDIETNDNRAILNYLISGFDDSIETEKYIGE